MQVRISQAVPMISKYLKAKLVTLLKGSPGIGKSQIYQQIADKYNLKLIDVRLSTCDLTDLCGFPQIMGNKAGYVPMNTFPIEGDEIPEGYSGWLLLFDELTSAAPALQAAAYKILLDRMIGIYPLHKNVAVCAAGNLETDNAVVEPMSTALQSRLVHIELATNAEDWLEWATSNGIDHRITSYIRFKPGQLYTFKSDHTDNTYACPRTWEFANRILGVTEDNDPLMLPLLAGDLSEGVAREFVVFMKIYNNLPTIDSIIASPGFVKVSDEPSILFAMCGSISHHAKPENIEALMTYVKRLPAEFQLVCVREIVSRQKSILGNPVMQRWLVEASDLLS